MKYFGGIILVLLVLSLGGCYYINATAPYTIHIENIASDATVVLNGTVVSNEGFNPREGVNRVTIIKDSKPIWVGQWVFEQGSTNDFIEELSLDSNVRVKSKGNKSVCIEIAMQDYKG